MRLIVAIQAFFAILFGWPLPAKAGEPEDKRREREQLQQDLSAARSQLEATTSAQAQLESERDQAQASLQQVQQELQASQQGQEAAAAGQKAAEETAQQHESRLGELSAELTQAQDRATALRAERDAGAEKLKQARDAGALALLAWLQREGRIIDFLMEDIDDYDDEQVGAAVRAIHKGCRKVLNDGLSLEPVLPGEEEDSVTVEAGFDPVAISLTGNVRGDPPFRGTLMHHGWRTPSVQVPVSETIDGKVLAPAEVEL